MKPLLVCLLLLAARCSAQTSDALATPTLRIETNLVYVPAQVATKAGEMIYGLKPEQFVLEDNGVAQKFRVDEDTDALGLSLVVLVQCSREAFAQFDRMRGLDAMVDDLVGGAPRQVALVSYGGEPYVLNDFTSDPRKLADGFSQLQPCDEGEAATLDAVNYANRMLEKQAANGNRRAILLISETRDHGSKMKPEVVIANLGRTNTVLDAVSFNPGKTEMLDSLIHGKYGPGYMGLLVMAVQAVRKNVPHTLAALTGGEYTNFSTQKGFDAGVHRLANHIHNFYLLSFQPAAGTPAGLHHLVVRVPDYADARIHSRLTYFAGEAAPAEVPETTRVKP